MKIASLLLIFLGTLFFLPSRSSATGNLDAQCSASASEMVPLNGGNAIQTFITNYDRFGGISFYLGSAGPDDPTGTFEFALRRENGTAIASGDITVTGGTPSGWYTIDMPGFEVTRGGTYQVYARSNNMGYTIGRSATNCYVSGVAYTNDSYELSDGGDWLFKTYGFNSDSTPPVLSNISVSNITKTSATVSWQSNETSAVDVAWGASTSYGSTHNPGPGQTSYNISGLSAGTTYHFHLRGSDASNNQSDWSADQSFTTLSDATAVTADTNTTAVTADTNTAPASNTSASIAKPADPKGEFVTAVNGVKISWTKSTTAGISGYKIYRSVEQTKGFVKIGQVGNNVVEYTDSTIESGKTYFYFVRAYKDGSESASSPTVSVAVPATAVTADATETAATATATSEATTAQATETAGEEKTKQIPLWQYIVGGVIILAALGFVGWKYIWPQIAKKYMKVNQ